MYLLEECISRWEIQWEVLMHPPAHHLHQVTVLLLLLLLLLHNIQNSLSVVLLELESLHLNGNTIGSKLLIDLKNIEFLLLLNLPIVIHLRFTLVMMNQSLMHLLNQKVMRVNYWLHSAHISPFLRHWRLHTRLELVLKIPRHMLKQWHSLMHKSTTKRL